MATKSSKTGDEEETQYATGPDQWGKPVGPEHDGSFHAVDFYDPETGERIPTDWDSEQQKADPGIEPPPPAVEPEPAPVAKETSKS